MTPPAEWTARLFHLGLLRLACLFVPAQQRVDWWREWHAELWHVRQSCAPVGCASWRGEREVTAFCLGAFQDALCLKRHCREKIRPFANFNGSPAQCVLFLGAVLAASYSIALLLPGVRAERSLLQHPVSRSLVLIRDAAVSDDSAATISLAHYKTWTREKQPFFDGFAFYRVTQELVGWTSASTGSQQVAAWGVAQASSNLLALMRQPVQFRQPESEGSGGIPGVILSEGLWKREFAASPHVAGRIVRLGEQNARIAGVAPDGAWGLPGKVDAWLLQPESAITPDRAGYVVAHLTALGEDEMWRPRVPITVFNANQSEDDLLGISLDEGMPQPWGVYLFTVILAFLALPATTSVSLGEYSVCSQRPSWWKTFSRWFFFGAKIGLLLPIVYFISLDLAYGPTKLDPACAVYIQLISSFSMCLFGLGWVLRDQRQRCPVCLRRVAHPAQVGQASHTFLAWNGTELMCMGGHTLLHVPGLPTSWFSTQRWLYLDTSWEFLFAASTAGAEKELLTGFSAH
jgi:hypothetical protein